MANNSYKNIDFSAYREEFPILKDKVYLASHSLGAVPRRTLDSLKRYYSQWAERGILAWEGPWLEVISDFCRNVEVILNAPAGSVVPLPNATRAMAAVASALEYPPDKNRIVLSDMEFTTFYPFWWAQRSMGAELHVVRSPDGMTVPPELFLEAIDERTVLVATCHAYFLSGAILDLRPIVEKAHRFGAYVLADGYQLVGRVPVDVSELGVDFYVGGSHKWLCGGAGAGYLYVRPELLPSLRPKLVGWFALSEPFSYSIDLENGGELRRDVFKFLDGTPNIPGLFAAVEGVSLIREVGPGPIFSHSQKLSQRIVEWALERGVALNSPPNGDERNGMVCLQIPEVERAVKWLEERGIIVDHRPGCGLRVSTHFYNDSSDIDKFLEAIDEWLGS